MLLAGVVVVVALVDVGLVVLTTATDGQVGPVSLNWPVAVVDTFDTDGDDGDDDDDDEDERADRTGSVLVP